MLESIMSADETDTETMGRNEDEVSNESPEKWPLDLLLVPVVNPEETEAFCEFVKAHLFNEKEAGDDPNHCLGRLNRHGLRRFGMLILHEHRITQGNTVMARIFFYKGTATCYDFGVAEELDVHPGEVWIDPVAIERRAAKWQRQLGGKRSGKDILTKKAGFHEAFHWYTAAPHFCLLRCMDELKGKPAMCYNLTYDVDRKKQAV